MNGIENQIQRIYTLSDLKFRVKFANGEVPIFKFNYFTESCRKFTVSWDGVKKENFEFSDVMGEIIVRRKAPHFTKGGLYVERCYPEVDNNFEDGIFDFLAPERTSIEITDQSDLLYRKGVQEVVPAYYPTISTEELEVDGEFWLGADGIAKQVYIKTFIGKIPAILPLHGNASDAYKYRLLLRGTNTKQTLFVCGGIRNITCDRQPNAHSISNKVVDTYTFSLSGGGVNLWFAAASPPFFTENDYSLTFKYTKV